LAENVEDDEASEVEFSATAVVDSDKVTEDDIVSTSEVVDKDLSVGSVEFSKDVGGVKGGSVNAVLKHVNHSSYPNSHYHRTR
jgi:hypothetical protein